MHDLSRQRPCPMPDLPPALTAMLADHDWALDQVGESGATIHHVSARGAGPDLYLKHGQASVADDIEREMTRMRWLAPYLPVPELVQYHRTPDEAWLVTTALPGRTAWQWLEEDASNAPAIIDALADFLRRFHAIAIDDCPFDSGHRLRLAQARMRIIAGAVDTDDFDEARQGWTADQVWDALQALLPLPPASVVTHGDFSLDNLLIQDGVVTGCIDLGRVGIADPYQDIAIMWNCLKDFGSRLQDRFLARYGQPIADQKRLDFHLLLDELF